MMETAAFILALIAVSPAPSVDAPDYRGAPASARGASALADGAHRVRGFLVSDVDEVTPEETLRAGIAFEMDPGWHIYWKRPGEGGAATAITLESLQATPGDVQWPMPSVFRESLGTLTTFGYDTRVLLFAPFQVTESSGVVEISARVEFVACDTECVPGLFELTRTFPIAAATKPSELAPLFNASQARVPSSASTADVNIALRTEFDPIGENSRFRGWYEIACNTCESLELASTLSQAFVSTASVELARLRPTQTFPSVSERPGVVIEFESVGHASTGDSPAKAVVGLVIDGRFTALELNHSLARDDANGPRDIPSYANDRAATPGVDSPLALWELLLFALVGGLLLNLMPCVLPVLTLKVASFAELAQLERGAILPHALAYLVAVVSSMLALAGAVVTLRALGMSVGWGFQFQSPLFVTLVGAVLVAFALNLFGVFEVSVGSAALQRRTDDASGVWRSFLEGVLAVVLATPCTAPLLGSAVGVALGQSAGVVFCTFGAIGVGLASPFVALVLVPGASRALPRPGAWMVTLKHVLGFALLGSAVWLGWVVGRGFGADAMARTFAFFVAVGMSTWLFGRWQTGTPQARTWSRALALAWLGVACFACLHFERNPEGLHWKTFSPEAVSTTLKSGRPVFVNFTADWCITCKVNERTVFAKPEVELSAEANKIALYKADWTTRDPDIEAVLSRHGRAGVPAYMLYSPTAPDTPRLLPEVLTPNLLQEAFKNVAR